MKNDAKWIKTLNDFFSDVSGVAEEMYRKGSPTEEEAKLIATVHSYNQRFGKLLSGRQKGDKSNEMKGQLDEKTKKFI